MSNSSETKPESDAARQHREMRERLAQHDLDGPHLFPDGPFGLLGARNRFAICTICGAMVVLNDLTADKPTVERSATLHTNWHADQK